MKSIVKPTILYACVDDVTNQLTELFETQVDKLQDAILEEFMEMRGARYQRKFEMLQELVGDKWIRLDTSQIDTLIDDITESIDDVAGFAIFLNSKEIG